MDRAPCSTAIRIRDRARSPRPPSSWLSFGTELGDPPDEIELVGAVEHRTADGPADLFVFRFRTDEPQWAAHHGWMIGVAGPYLRSEQPTTHGLGQTFSRLASEEAMSLEEHLGQLVGDMRAWHSAPDRSDP